MKVVCINNITTSFFEEGEVETDLIIGEIYNELSDINKIKKQYKGTVKFS